MRIRVILGTFFLAGLLTVVLAACGGGAPTSPPARSGPPPQGTQDVKVTITDTTITSSLTTFYANKPYYFTVTNRGHSPHNFIIRVRPGQGAVKPQQNQGILYSIPSTQLSPGATKSFSFAFPDATAQPASPQGNTSSVQFTTQIRPVNGPSVAIPVEVKRG